MNWGEGGVLEKGVYHLPEQWIGIEYYEMTNLLYRIENSLRVFLYTVLKITLKQDWDLIGDVSVIEVCGNISCLYFKLRCN